MSYTSFKSLITEKINSSSDKTEIGRMRHHLTALNNLVEKYSVLTIQNFAVGLTSELDSTLEDYKKRLLLDNKSDVRSPLTRVRKLAAFYTDVTFIDTSDMTFTEIVQNALRNLYGDALYEGIVTPENSHKVRSTRTVTYGNIAMEVLKDARKKHPKLYNIDWKSYDTHIAEYGKAPGTSRVNGLESALITLRSIFLGKTVPTYLSNLKKISHLEECLLLPSGTLLNKISKKDKKPVSKGKIKKQKQQPKFNDTQQLSPLLHEFYNNYSEFKINAIQPELVNVTKEMIRTSSKRIRVKESKKWTVSATNNICNAQVVLYKALVCFVNYCVKIKKVPFNEVSTKHLTDPSLIYDMCHWSIRENRFKSLFKTLLNTIKRCIENEGFLRLCGELGDRSNEDFNRDLGYIEDEYEELLYALVNSIDKGNVGGKKNIDFLLDLKSEDRRLLVNRCNSLLIEEANVLIKEGEQYLSEYHRVAEAAGIKTDKFEHHQLLNRASNKFKEAYEKSLVAMIFEVSFVVAPRAGSWCALLFFNSASSHDERFPSFVFHRQKNKYQIKIPKYGSTLVSGPDKLMRVLKNSDASETVPVDVLLPEYLTGVISRFLNARKHYIETYMPFTARRGSELVINRIHELKEGEDFPLRKHYLAELEKDNKAYLDFETDSVQALFPFMYRPPSRMTIPKTDTEVTNKEVVEQKTNLRRVQLMDTSTIYRIFINITRDAFEKIDPELVDPGVNIHATRHLSATTYLDNNPGDFYGAAAILNDRVEQVIKVYGEKDRAKRMRELGKHENPALTID